MQIQNKYGCLLHRFLYGSEALSLSIMLALRREGKKPKRFGISPMGGPYGALGGMPIGGGGGMPGGGGALA